MASAIVKERRLIFNGVSYFRTHAEEAAIGSFGKKRKNVLKKNYLQVINRISFPKKSLESPVIVGIDSNKTSRKAFNAGVSVIGIPVKAEGGAAFNKLTSGEYKLVKFSVSIEAMMKAANKSLDRLKESGATRIVHQVFVVMEAAQAKMFANEGNVKISFVKEGIKAVLGAGASSSGKTSITISEGTIFAYLLLKIKWNKEKSMIKSLDIDQYGVG